MTDVKTEPMNGATSPYLILTYKQTRGYDEGRVFVLEVPKNPIHYIEDGFVPDSAIPENAVEADGITNVLSACLYLDLSTETYDCDTCDVKYTECPAADVAGSVIANIMISTTDVGYQEGDDRVSNIKRNLGWANDVVEFWLNNYDADNDVTETGFHVWKFVIKDFVTPSSSKPVTT